MRASADLALASQQVEARVDEGNFLPVAELILSRGEGFKNFPCPFDTIHNDKRKRAGLVTLFDELGKLPNVIFRCGTERERSRRVFKRSPR